MSAKSRRKKKRLKNRRLRKFFKRREQAKFEHVLSKLNLVIRDNQS